MDHLRRKEIHIRLPGKTYIYQPISRTVEGKIDGEEYEIKVMEPELPAGTVAGPPQNVQVFGWDEAMYIWWEDPPGPVKDYTFKILDSNDNLVTEALGLDSGLNEFTITRNDSQDKGLFTNGNQYSIELGASFFDVIDYAPEELFTPSDKTVQNLALDGKSGNTINISWDAVSGGVKYYKIYVKNTTDNNVEQVITGIQGTATIVYGLKDESDYEVWVTAVSTLEIFEGDESTHITFTVDITPPDSPSNLQGTKGIQSVSLTWDSSPSADTQGYNVYVDGVKGNNSLITSTSYTVNNIPSGQVYDFTVKAVDDQNNLSSPSNVVSIEPEGIPYLNEDFQDDLSDWGNVYNGFTLRTDRSYEGGQSGGVKDGDPTYLQAEHDMGGGVKIEAIEWFWTEETNSYGGGLKLINSNGDEECGAFSSNPDWDLLKGGSGGYNGYQLVYIKSNQNYEDWNRFRIYFDWNNSKFRFYGVDLADNETFIGEYNLLNGVDIQKVQIVNYSADNNATNTEPPQGTNSPMYMWFDNIRMTNKPFEVGDISHSVLNGEISLSWDANQEYDLDGYNVYVDGAKDNGSLISGTSYQITRLNNGQSYDINVTAVDTEGAESAQSTTVSATPTTSTHLVLNGTDQYVDLGLLGSFGSTILEDHTMEFRIKSSQTTRKNFFGVVQDQQTLSSSFGQVWNIGANNGIVDEIGSFLRDDSTTVFQFSAPSVPEVNDGNAHMLTFYFNPPNNTIKIYVDGVLQSVNLDRSESPNDWIDLVRNFFLGALNSRSGDDHHLEGVIDEFRIWQGERTQTEIQNTMDSELNTPNGWDTDYPSLFRYYKFNNGSGDQAIEEVAGDHATLVGNVGDNMWRGGNL